FLVEWFFLLVVLGIGALFAFGSNHTATPARTPDAADDNAPLLLKKSRLLLVEQTLRIQDPTPIKARVDEVYQQPNGELIIVDTKARNSSRVYMKDVIQLSLYGYILRKMGHRVSPFGYVRVQKPETVDYLIAPLLSEAELMQWFERAKILEQGLSSPRFCEDARKCEACSERNGCKALG
ncbi:PD-(D/E)XK nuclease family protein, partial [Thiolapillus sp.]|uniref:PD-(D/E)XK nuclease family protein n=1 Tax=Thiolapillus sp. TaxID=2017437 RepID=UPI003AF5A861